MRETITYRQNSAAASEITAHLMACDTSFIPPLSARVTLEDYTNKLIANAQRIEAWESGQLVGLAVFYINQPPRAFLTNISVLPGYQRRGIAAALMKRFREQALGAELASMALEVGSANVAAIGLYRAHGFTIAEQTGEQVTMVCELERDSYGTKL